MEDRTPIVGLSYIQFRGANDESELEERATNMLARALNSGRIVGFVGAGVSKAYGYPLWTELVHDIVSRTLADGALEPGGVRHSLLNALGTQGPHTADAGMLQQLKRLATVESEGDIAAEDLPLMRQLADQAARTKLRWTERALLCLEVCQLVAEAKGENAIIRFKQDIDALIRPQSPSHPEGRSADPLRALIKGLSVTRFVTTNYDVEIERALVRDGGCAPEDLNLDGALNPLESTMTRPRHFPASACALCASPEAAPSLIRFAARAPGYAKGVLHLHGVVGRPDSLVLTERDYQRLYHGDDPKGKEYREALNVLLAGSAFLFVGYGMGEEDVLRPLRQFVARPQKDRREREVFALLERPGSDLQAHEWRLFLHQRYGVKVIYYPPDEPRAQSLERALENLAEAREGWWHNWQRKPLVRRAGTAEPRQDDLYVHHRIHPPAPRIERPVDELAIRTALGEAGGAILLYGRPGAGKGELAQRLVDAPPVVGAGAYERRFLASMRFSNGYHSVVQAAARWFRPEHIESMALDKLCEALERERHLLVIGGLGRLLRPLSRPIAEPEGIVGPPPDAVYGEPIHAGANYILQRLGMAAAKGRSDVVYAGDLIPVVQPLDRGDDTARPPLRVVQLGGVTPEDLLKEQPFASIGESTVRDLHRTLRGHHYALTVAQDALERADQGERDALVARWVSRLSRIGGNRRPEAFIGIILEDSRNWSEGVPWERVLEQLSMFTEPVPAEALSVDLPGRPNEGQVSRWVQELYARRLVLRVRTEEPGAVEHYTTHSLVRAFVQHGLGVPQGSPGEGTQFAIMAVAGRGGLVGFGSQRVHEMAALSVDSLLDRLEGEEPSISQRPLARAAFGILRARWSAADMGQLAADPRSRSSPGSTLADGYALRLARLANVIVHTTPQSDRWVWMEPTGTEGVVSYDAVLHIDELAWLYNEMGMSAYYQGMTEDAWALFRATRQITDLIDAGRVGRRKCLARLNMAAVHLERGNLDRAKRRLLKAGQMARELQDLDIEARVTGFLALIAHLQSDLKRARKLYRTAIAALEKTGNDRGRSIFTRHRGDLHRRLGDPRSAHRDFVSARALAEQGRFFDLVHRTRLSSAKLAIEFEQAGPVSINRIVREALDFSRRVGFPKLGIHAHEEVARLAMSRGEYSTAQTSLLRALEIATSHGLRLKVTRLLTFLGDIAQRRSDNDSAAELLTAAIELGMAQGYHLRVETARQIYSRTLPGP